jgi:hypothetical protein
MEEIQMEKIHTHKSEIKPYSVEFFHIYTDEVIGDRHIAGLEVLRQIEQTWKFNYEKIILIDDYNPSIKKTDASDVLDFLESKKMSPDYWAYESKMVENASTLLTRINNNKIKNNYLKYIEKNNKYPCSLLTASWYLTRLGYLDTGIINPVRTKSYRAADHLLNLLPQDYEQVEQRTRLLITKSEFFDAVDRIQDLFYPTISVKTIDLF